MKNWNKQWYSAGNPFKVRFRKHYCCYCGTELQFTKHRKIVDQKSEEAKYYDFRKMGNGVILGSCEFIHKVFYCPKCNETIEFITQLNQEDIDIIIDKVTKYFAKKGRDISITKGFETRQGQITERVKTMENVVCLWLSVMENGKKTVEFKAPVLRRSTYERPYFFKVSQRELIKFMNDIN